MRTIYSLNLVFTMFLMLGVSPNLASADEFEVDANKMRGIEATVVKANGIEIAYKVLGEQGNPVVLMVMGLGGSHLLWGDQLPLDLVDAGYQVVLFDNRDVGESQRLDELGEPIIWWEFIKLQLGFEVNAGYDLSDMAKDTIGLMDAIDIDQAHVVGASMGGMIAQVMAARYPQRVTSLTSIMSTPGFADHLPPPGQVEGQLTKSPEDETEEETKARLESYGLYLDSMPRQLLAILKSGDRSEEVKTITAPTLVLHGIDDTLIPVEHGEYTAEIIEGAKFMAFEGMGHNLPEAVMPKLVSNMVAHLKAHDLPTSVAATN